MSDFLADMAARSLERAAAVPDYGDAELDRPRYPITLEGFGIIAEIKKRSPAEGALAAAATDGVARAGRYVDGGAAAISVLTEAERFDGSLADLDAVARAIDPAQIPVMRKDFLVAANQVTEAAACGASGVLLIAAILDDAALVSMLDCAFELGLFVLLESFGVEDLARSTALIERPRYAERATSHQLLFGVNTRDLRSLAVDPGRLQRFASRVPRHAVCVAESGLSTPADAARVAALGYRMGLVGSALMRSEEPERLLAGMLDAARKEIAA